MILSILICSLNKRKEALARLLSSLPETDGVEVLVSADDGEVSTGEKRNRLLQTAKGEYICFIDDDDHVTAEYLPCILKALEAKPDAIGFKGWMTTNKKGRCDWKISKDLKYETIKKLYKTEYHRFNNHLSPVRREIALQIGFPDLYHGEDFDYAKRMHDSGLILTEVFIDRFIYHYDFFTK